MTRKEQLQRRAHRFSKAFDESTACFGQRNAAVGFEQGYRAAMKDLRKLIRNAGRDTAHIKDPFKRARVRHGFIAAEVSRWLRPLR